MSGLLEEVLNKSDFSYISDLSGKINEQSIKQALQMIQSKEYSEKEWSEAIHYLSGGSRALQSIEEVERYISRL